MDSFIKSQEFHIPCRFQIGFAHSEGDPEDTVIRGEVLIVDAPNRLSYTWESDEKHTVTWTLQDLGDGKVNLHLEQTGIGNAQGLEGAKYGWTNWCGELEKVLEQ